MGIDGVGKINNFVIDQTGKYLFVTNEIEIPGASFKDILGAKVINDSGQNMHKCEMSDKVPESQKHGIDLIR